MARKFATVALFALSAGFALLPGRPSAAARPDQITGFGQSATVFGSVLSNSPGDLDPTFDGDGKAITDFGKNEIAHGMVIQQDGKIVVVGGDTETARPRYYRDFVLARYLSNGSLDPGFGGGRVRTDFADGSDHAYGVVQQVDGKLVVAGFASGPTFDLQFAIARYNGDSSLDSSFDGDGKTLVSFGAGSAAARAVALQADGRIVVGGSASSPTGSDFALARLNTNGGLDTSFGGDGLVLTDLSPGEDLVTSLAVQPDGKILTAGIAFPGREALLARYQPNGELDASFDGDGKVTTSVPCCANEPRLALQSDGKILVAAGSVLLRYKADGSLDSGFGTDGKVTVTPLGTSEAVVPQPDGKIVSAGSLSTSANVTGFAVTRYAKDGSEDPNFDSNIVDVSATDRTAAVGLQSDRKIVLAGSTGTAGPDEVLDFIVIRFLNPAPPAARCRVPNVRGRKLPAARSAITKARCSVGKVRRRASKKVKHGRVISQSPKAGKTLPNRGKVNLVVSRGQSR